VIRTAGNPGSWRGPTREYDLVKEFVIALVVVSLLTVALATLFSSPDEKNLTLQSWAAANPNDFVATATAELAGTSGSAGYGAPYNAASEGQKLGPLPLQKWGGVRIPVDPANDFVVTPLSTLAADASAQSAVTAWRAATPDQQTAWAGAYADAIEKADGDPAAAAQGDYGPVPAMTKALLGMAAGGALDTQLVATRGEFFQTDYTKPLLFLADGTYLEDTAGTQHLTGGQWGMMNETGKYPGQAWLWLFTFWYQIPPFTTEGSAWADNADIIIFAIMILLSIGLLLVPFIPGLRSIPQRIPLYRVIWRRYYAQVGRGSRPAKP
jgi:hypothetical protein